METELQQAERTARFVVENQFAYGPLHVVVCRVFLAQQARLAEVERERDGYRLDAVRAASAHLDTLGKLAAAERKATEAAREALTRLAEHFQRIQHPVYVINIEVFRDREYPAPTEREATPPQAAPEQVVLYANVDGERKHIRLTPEDCRRIVETGRASGRGE